MYYGTVARYRIKPGQEEKLMGVMKDFEKSPPAGWTYTTVFRSAEDENEIWMSVVFDSEESYRKNADSPDMDSQYKDMLEHLQGEPEWHDGHVIHEAMRKQ